MGCVAVPLRLPAWARAPLAHTAAASACPRGGAVTVAVACADPSTRVSSSSSEMMPACMQGVSLGADAVPCTYVHAGMLPAGLVLEAVDGFDVEALSALSPMEDKGYDKIFVGELRICAVQRMHLPARAAACVAGGRWQVVNVWIGPGNCCAFKPTECYIQPWLAALLIYYRPPSHSAYRVHLHLHALCAAPHHTAPRSTS